MATRSPSVIEYDELTKLPSMMYFRRYAGSYVEYARKFGRNSYLVYFNLENFSVFNERYGFEEGDRLLVLMSLAIQMAFPGYLVSRFSDDHFLLVCANGNLEEGIRDVRDQVHSYGRHANVELKAGVYEFGDESPNIGRACDRAKYACDSISHRYDLMYRVFDETLRRQIDRSKYIESHIESAIQNGWIKVYYQPIVRSISGQVCEFEALARWEDPRYGLLSPAVFVDVLEQSRLIHKLDSHVVRTVCSEWRKLRSYKKWHVPVSVNLSRFDFELCDAFELVDSAAREFDIPRQMLHVEITESALNENATLLLQNVERFRSAGYQVWLDDFGSGYSSLNTLKDYVFDVVKIDMGFLREFDTKPQSRVIISSVVNMAKQLGMQTLIEGVETPEQFDYLHDIGCEFIQGYLVGKPSPSEHNVERILSGELVIEPSVLHGYYDRLGSINYLSATPFEFSWDTGSKSVTSDEMLPLAVMEREVGAFTFVSANEAFVRTVAEIGLGSLSDLAETLTEADKGPARIAREAIRAAVASSNVESVDIMHNGRQCMLRVRHVSSHDNVDAFLVSLMDLSHFSDVAEERRLQVAMRYLYAIYEEVNLIDLSQGTIGTIYRGSTSLPSIDHETPIRQAAEEYVEQLLNPEDLDRFTRYMDISTMSKRCDASPGNYLADAFRMLQPSGMYEWVTITLVPVLMDGDQKFLECVRKTNTDILTNLHANEKIPKSILWDTLIDLVPAGVFWKDADRRFVGVNKNFLDFYSFESTADVLGKNDEEMGWHVSTDAFKNNELRVLEGDSVLNAKGTCIAQGGVRNIVASKIPLWHNGEVIGLLGYFTDTTGDDKGMHRVIFDGFNRMAETDQLTGIPNLQGFISSAVSYEDAYMEDGIDFVNVIIDIDGMTDLNGVYGRSFGNQVLKAVGRALNRAVSVSGVVARVGGDKFAALKQVTDKAEGIETMRELVDTIGAIREVAGTRLHLRCYSGYAMYSEREGMVASLRLADERMHESREVE